jgi:hypothetical protein
MFCWPASLYNFVNKANFVHNLFLAYLFLVNLSISACFGRLCARHQEKQLCLCDTWYLLFCADYCLVCRVRPCIPDSHPHRITSTKCRISTVVSPDDGHIVAWNMQRLINVLRINIRRINCAPSWLYLQDCKFIYSSHSLRHVSAGNCSHHRVVLQLYKREEVRQRDLHI